MRLEQLPCHGMACKVNEPSFNPLVISKAKESRRACALLLCEILSRLVWFNRSIRDE